MMRTVDLPWGMDVLSVRLPKTWRVLGELKPRSIPPAERVADACAHALRDPVAAQPLGPRDLRGKRIVMVVDDHSRPTPVREFIHPVLTELKNAGVSDEDLRILVATGVHRASRPEEVEKKLGSDVMSSFRWDCHNAYDEDGLVQLGVTSRGTPVEVNKLLGEADLIVCLGALEPHLLLGFGGGLKTIIPGCAGAKTIAKNHMQGVNPEVFNYAGVRGEDSPMRQDLEEGARMLRADVFMVNAAMNEQARPTRFFCGDPIAAHRAGESFVDEVVRLDVPEQANVVLSNSFPMDLDVRQSVKCIGNAYHACRPDGVLLGCLKAEDGVGEMPMAAKTLPYSVMRGLLKVIGKKRILGLVERVKKGQPAEELFLSHFALQMLARVHLAMFSDSPKLPKNLGRRMGLARSYTSVQDMIHWTAGKVPRSATVWVFPYGGSTYARYAPM